MIRQAKRPAATKPMPRKLDSQSDTERLQLVAPSSWIKRVDEWRRKQPDLPNRSDAIRKLVDIAVGVRDAE